MAISITKPTVGASQDTWGTTLNTALDTIVDAVNGTSGTTAPNLQQGSWKIGGTAVTSTADELNLLDGAVGATVVDGKAVVYGDDGELVVNQIYEKVTTDTSTSGVIDFDVNTQAIMFFTVNQSANRTINFRADASTALNDVMAVGQSLTLAVPMTQGSTAYYLDTFQIDGTAVTPKWQGGLTPDAGNASGIDVYSFTIIKTASATYTILAAQSQFA